MKNKFIRLMSLFIVTILLLGAYMPAASAVSTPFEDVPAGVWFHDAVAWAYINGLAQGTSPTTFSPNNHITRGQFVTFLYRLEAEPPMDDLIRFSDVANPGQYFFNAVNWAFENGIVTGIGGGLFAPDRTITREEMAVMLFRFARYHNENTSAPVTALNHFPDRFNVFGWALDGVRWAASNGILRGNGLRRLNPKGLATRAEAITVIQRYVFKEWYIPPDPAIDPTKPMIALTYDDGPTGYTEEVLNVLERHGVPATFYVNGRNIEANRSTLLRAFNMGNEIGNHSWSHPWLSTLTLDGVRDEIVSTSNAIWSVTGVFPATLRPGYGDYNQNVITVAAENGMPIINWTLNGEYNGQRYIYNAGEVANHVVSNSWAGEIVLLHDYYDDIAAATDLIITELKRWEYQFVTISELLFFSNISLSPGQVYGQTER